MRKNFRINGIDVQPGHRAIVNIPVAELHTHAEMTMPVQVVHGKKEGPCLFVSAAVHGDEILGVEIVRRLIRYTKTKRIRGTLLVVPVVNVYGFIHHSRYLPDRRDLNRFFPGTETGSLASRLARIFMDEVVDRCTHGIDLHTGAQHRINLPQVRASLADPETCRLAEAFGAPVIIDANLRDGSLREAVKEKGIPMLLYEAGEVLRFDEIAVRTGFRGILAVMHAIGMLPGDAAPGRKTKPITARTTTWVRAPKSGILRTHMLLGNRVAQSERMGVIADPFGENEETVPSPAAGIIIGRSNMPLVHEGDAIFHIACVDKTTLTASDLGNYEHGRNQGVAGPSSGIG